ncbi:MAG: hypothetical protein JWO37_1897 [Acidimicrobiales bacterium]|jgi:hypothetical protein|nr:hypothetical protein [Acidimicrobiales bacterium]
MSSVEDSLHHGRLLPAPPFLGRRRRIIVASVARVSTTWPPLSYEVWSATCDTLHAHSQVLGKLAVALAPPEPQLQHAALRLSGRGWETLPLPAPDGSGALVVALDLHTHHAVAEHTDGRVRRVPLARDRPVADVTREVLAAVGDLVGPVQINPTPQETPWTTPLDEDVEHATYDPNQATAYFAAATQAALVLAALRAPYRGRATPVNAWWGSFDLAVSLFSGRRVDPPSNDFIMRNSGDAQQIEVGWWPGDARYPHAAFFAYAFPAPDGFENATLSPAAARWDAGLGEYVLDWDDVRVAPDPHRAALDFGRSAIRHACMVCSWDPELAASAEGVPPPIN